MYCWEADHTTDTTLRRLNNYISLYFASKLIPLKFVNLTDSYTTDLFHVHISLFV